MFPDLGLFLLRIVVGSLLAGHGAQKTFGWFGDRARTVAAFEAMGYRPADRFVTIAGWVQLGGGILVTAGFLLPVGSALIAGSSVQAIKAAKWRNGLWTQGDGYEYLLVLTTAVTTLALTGPGRYALDGGLTMPPVAALVLVGVALVAGLALPKRLPAQR